MKSGFITLKIKGKHWFSGLVQEAMFNLEVLEVLPVVFCRFNICNVIQLTSDCK
jgi:hypothetical protein